MLCTRASLRYVTAPEALFDACFLCAFHCCASRTCFCQAGRQAVVRLTGSAVHSHLTSRHGAARAQIGVLQWFARLWDIDQDEYWGYITNCGTEGNLHGILVGRENLPDGILYASRESHYSVFKWAPSLALELLCKALT